MELSTLINFKNNYDRIKLLKANIDNIVPFVGAGISKMCGLYTWRQLLDALAEDYLNRKEIAKYSRTRDYIAYADRVVEVSGNQDIIMKRIREILEASEISKNEIAYLLVSGFSPMVITTNYDTLLENASLRSNKGKLKPLLPCLEGQINEAIQINDRCLLKLHGSVEETQSIILTSEQYKRFYGEKNDREGKYLPNLLKKIFSSRKVLFVGCSLENDLMLEVLEDSINQKDNKSVSHYAIVPWPKSRSRQLSRNRALTKLGVEPIYYPEGDYSCVGKIINYLSGEPRFITNLRQIFVDIFEEDFDDDVGTLLSTIKESFNRTAIEFPQLLDIDVLKDDFTEDIIKTIGTSRKQTDTLLQLTKDAFAAYTKASYLSCHEDVTNSFNSNFEKLALKENNIVQIINKRWSVERYLSKKAVSDDMSWIKKLSSNEISNYVNDILKKLHYRNGMSFHDIVYEYCHAKLFLENAEKHLDFTLKIRLLNAIGAFSHYSKDAKNGVIFLKRCIQEIDNSGRCDREIMLLKAQCYANLAITLSLCGENIYTIIDVIEKDISIKKTYGESNFLYSRSLNTYATVLKEIDPFDAIDAYIQSAQLKEQMVCNEIEYDKIRELTASWATTVFNIGLLAKDFEFYNISYEIIRFANKKRFETLDPCNRDYCSSLNVLMELELFLHEKRNLQNLIQGIESRVSLPEGFSETQAHTWYICSYYYYLDGDYFAALKYIDKTFCSGKKEGALYDFRQDIRAKILLADIKIAQSAENPALEDEAIKIYCDAISSVVSAYGPENFYLLGIYRHVLKKTKNDNIKKMYMQTYAELQTKYEERIKIAEIRLNEYAEKLKKAD